MPWPWRCCPRWSEQPGTPSRCQFWPLLQLIGGNVWRICSRREDSGHDVLKGSRFYILKKVKKSPSCRAVLRREDSGHDFPVAPRRPPRSPAVASPPTVRPRPVESACSRFRFAHAESGLRADQRHFLYVGQKLARNNFVGIGVGRQIQQPRNDRLESSRSPCNPRPSRGPWSSRSGCCGAAADGRFFWLTARTPKSGRPSIGGGDFSAASASLPEVDSGNVGGACSLSRSIEGPTIDPAPSTFSLLSSAKEGLRFGRGAEETVQGDQGRGGSS